MTENRSLVRNTAMVMAAFVLANLTGLARQIIINRTFGTSFALDAYFAAFQVPDLLFTVVAGGALGSAFIPVFAGLLAQGDDEHRRQAWRLASSIINLVLLATAVGAAVAALFAPWLIDHLLAPSFDAELVSLTAALMRIMLVSTMIFGVSGLLMGIHNAHNHFLAPALAPVLYNLGIMFGAVVLTPSLGIFGLAWGVTIGAALHLLIQLPVLARHQPQYGLILDLRNADVLTVGRLMLPRTLGLAVWRINFWVNTAIGSGLPEGNIAALNIAFQMFTFPQAVIAQAIATVVFPTFSAQAARNELPAMRATMAQSLRAVLYLSIPATAGMIVLGGPIIALLFQNAEFTANSTALVAWALAWYAAGLVGHSTLEIVTRAFYALKDTATPVAVAVVAMLLNVVLSFGFVALFDRLGWPPVGGLALANTVATAVEVGVLLVRLRPRMDGLDGGTVLRGILPPLAGTVVMTLVLVSWLWVAPDSVIVVSVVGAGLGGAVFYLVTLALGSPEARLVPEMVLRRLRR